jgi:hypothetical protein
MVVLERFMPRVIRAAGTRMARRTGGYRLERRNAIDRDFLHAAVASLVDKQVDSSAGSLL